MAGGGPRCNNLGRLLALKGDETVLDVLGGAAAWPLVARAAAGDASDRVP
jgi:hypothetical protein